MSGSRPYASVAMRAHRSGALSAFLLLAVTLASCTDEDGVTRPDPLQPIEPGAREFILTTTDDAADCDPAHGECSLYGAIEAASRDPDGGPHTLVLAGDETYRLTLPALPGSGDRRDDASTVVIEGHGATIEQELSGRAFALQGGEERHGGWRYRWNDGSQPGLGDVYFLHESGVLRNPDSESPDDAPLFNVAGVPLDMTVGAYRGAEARSLAVVSPGDEPTTTFIVHLQGLVPEGVYSLYYTTFAPDSENPLCPNALRDLPLTSIVPDWQRPDPSSFVTNGQGEALFVGNVAGDLLDPMLLSVQVIYHADGETYYPLPNRGAFATQGENCRSSYGVDAMRQILILQKWDF